MSVHALHQSTIYKLHKSVNIWKFVSVFEQNNLNLDKALLYVCNVVGAKNGYES